MPALFDWYQVVSPTWQHCLAAFSEKKPLLASQPTKSLSAREVRFAIHNA